MTATITSKGQITIPKEVRDRLNLAAGSQVDFVFDESGNVMMKPLNWEWKSLRGILKSPSKTPLTIREMDGLIAREVVRLDERTRHKRAGASVHQGRPQPGKRGRRLHR